MKTKILIIGLFISIFSFTGVALAHNDNQCNANNFQNCPDPLPICDNGLHIGNPHCILPTPTNTPTPVGKVSCTPTPTERIPDEDSPTPINEVTPTAGDSATPTPVPGGEKGDDSGDPNSCLHHDCSGNKVGGGSSAGSSVGSAPQLPPATGKASN